MRTCTGNGSSSVGEWNGTAAFCLGTIIIIQYSMLVHCNVVCTADWDLIYIPLYTHTCVDINECSEDTDGCDQICTNSPGSYNCDCNSTGYLLAVDGRGCKLISCNDPLPCIIICLSSGHHYLYLCLYIQVMILTSVLDHPTSVTRCVTTLRDRSPVDVRQDMCWTVTEHRVLVLAINTSFTTNYIILFSQKSPALNLLSAVIWLAMG